MADLDVSVLLRLVAQFGDAQKAEKELLDVRRAAQQLNGTTAGDKLGRSLERVSRSGDKTERELRDVRRAADGLDNGRPGAALAANLERAGRAAGRTEGQLRGVGRAARSLETIKLSGLSQQIGAVDGKLVAVTRGLRTAAAGFGIGVAAKELVMASVDVEKAIAEVRRFYNVDDPIQIAKIKADITALSDELGISQEKVAAIYAGAGKQGMPLAEVKDYAKDIVQISVAWDASGDRVVDGLGIIRSAFHLNRQEAVKTAAAINTLADGLEGPVGEEGLLDFLARVGATAAGTKIGAKNVAAFGAALAGMGIQTDVAATTVKALLTRLDLAAYSSKEAQASFRRLGFDPKQFGKAFDQDALKATLDFLDSLSRSKDATRDLKDIFGLEYTDNANDLVNALGNIRKGLSLIGNDASNVEQLKRGFDIFTGTTAADIDRTFAALKTAADSVAHDWLPAINTGLGAFQGYLKDLRENGTIFDDIEAGLGGMAKGLGYGSAGVMLKDLATQVGAISANSDDAGERLGKIFETARTNAEGFLAVLKQIRDMHDAVFGSGDKQKTAQQRVDEQTADWMVEWREKHPDDGMILDALDGLLGGDPRYAAAKERRRSLKAGEPPKPAEGPAPAGATPAGDKAGAAERIAVAFDATSAARPAEEMKARLDAIAAAAQAIGSQTMSNYNSGLQAQGASVLGWAKGFAAQLQSILGISVTPQVNIPTIHGGPAGTSPGGGTAAPAAVAPGKQSSVTSNAPVQLTQHFHGVGNPAAVAAAARRRQNREVQLAQARALHDLGRPA